MTKGVIDKQIKIGIIGLGLIGSSILKKLYNNSSYEIFCTTQSSKKEALKYTKNVFSTYEELKICDIIFVCSKASDTTKILNKLNNILDKKNVVVDVCSIKKNLLNKKYNFNFILSHPMAGTQFSGFNAGFCELFIDSRWLIEKENKILIKIIKDLGAIPKKINMKSHDNLCCQISHFPTILSFLLFSCTEDNAKQIASSGFRDMTRLAQTNSDLAFNMFENNSENMEKILNKINLKFKELKNLNKEEKIEFFNSISKKREKMYNKDGKNVFKN